MAEEKDQALTEQSTEVEEKEPTTLDEHFDIGFEKLEAEATAKEEKKKEETKPEEKKDIELAKDEELCPECPEGKKKKEPYKVIKRKGEDIPVYSQEEYDDLASKGLDYTKKTQDLASDRKDAEAKYQEKEDVMTALTEKFNAMAISFEERGILPSTKIKEETPKTKEEIYKDYGIDEEYAEPWQHRLVDEVVKLKEDLKESKQKNLQNEGFIKNIATKEATKGLADVIIEAKKKYPFEEIFSDDKKINYTARQFVRAMKEKVDTAKEAGNPYNIADIAIETTKEFSEMQRKTAEKKGPGIAADMSVDDIKANYPELYGKILEYGKDQGVAEHLDGKTDSAPSLTQRKVEVDTSKKEPVSGDIGSLIDQAFEEIDFTEKE